MKPYGIKNKKKVGCSCCNNDKFSKSVNRSNTKKDIQMEIEEFEYDKFYKPFRCGCGACSDD